MNRGISATVGLVFFLLAAFVPFIFGAGEALSVMQHTTASPLKQIAISALGLGGMVLSIVGFFRDDRLIPVFCGYFTIVIGLVALVMSVMRGSDLPIYHLVYLAITALLLFLPPKKRPEEDPSWSEDVD